MTRSPEYPDRPVVGVGGVVVVDHHAVLIRRANEPRKGQWSIPGGRLEPGETLADGVRRELLEEIGMEVEVGALIEAFERIYRDPDGRLLYHFVILDYLCRTRSQAPVAGGDALEVAMAREGDLDRFALSEAVLRVLREAFAMARGV